MTPDTASFACAYAVTVATDDLRTAEQWARELWEGASPPLRWFMVLGWWLALRLRLGPHPSPVHVLGWPIVERSATHTVCHAHSGFLSACNDFRLMDGQLVWSTLVSYDRPVARVIWPPVAVIHRLLVRLALRRATQAG